MGRHRATAAVVAMLAGITALIAACEGGFPFNVYVLPFLPPASVEGVYEVDTGIAEVLPGTIATPAFSLSQLPLSDVQIPFEAPGSADPTGITSARVELRIESALLPANASVELELESDVSIYVAPGNATNRFDPVYKVSLGRAVIGSSSVVDLQGELTAEQLEYLSHGELLLGLEFSGTAADVHNLGGELYLFQGLSWQLTDLRIRGSVALSSFGIARGPAEMHADV